MSREWLFESLSVWYLGHETMLTAERDEVVEAEAEVREAVRVLRRLRQLDPRAFARRVALIMADMKRLPRPV